MPFRVFPAGRTGMGTIMAVFVPLPKRRGPAAAATSAASFESRRADTAYRRCARSANWKGSWVLLMAWLRVAVTSAAAFGSRRADTAD